MKENKKNKKKKNKKALRAIYLRFCIHAHKLEKASTPYIRTLGQHGSQSLNTNIPTSQTSNPRNFVPIDISLALRQ